MITARTVAVIVGMSKQQHLHAQNPHTQKKTCPNPGPGKRPQAQRKRCFPSPPAGNAEFNSFWYTFSSTGPSSSTIA
jgi:hypothetical protein